MIWIDLIFEFWKLDTINISQEFSCSLIMPWHIICLPNSCWTEISLRPRRRKKYFKLFFGSHITKHSDFPLSVIIRQWVKLSLKHVIHHYSITVLFKVISLCMQALLLNACELFPALAVVGWCGRVRTSSTSARRLASTPCGSRTPRITTSCACMAYAALPTTRLALTLYP